MTHSVEETRSGQLTGTPAHYAAHHLRRMMQDQAKLESEDRQKTGFLQRPVCNVVKMKPQRTFSSFPNSG